MTPNSRRRTGNSHPEPYADLCTEEALADLKNLKRATIIGETTGGGAHPVAGHRIDEHFMIGVPFARAINPITHTNWEGVGVKPDIMVPAKDALATAQKLLAEKPRQ